MWLERKIIKSVLPLCEVEFAVYLKQTLVCIRIRCKVSWNAVGINGTTIMQCDTRRPHKHIISWSPLLYALDIRTWARMCSFGRCVVSRMEQRVEMQQDHVNRDIISAYTSMYNVIGDYLWEWNQRRNNGTHIRWVQNGCFIMPICTCMCVDATNELNYSSDDFMHCG